MGAILEDPMSPRAQETAPGPSWDERAARSELILEQFEVVFCLKNINSPKKVRVTH